MGETEKVCAFEGCRAQVDEDDYCHGCEAYTCDKHSQNYDLPFAEHNAEAHWEAKPLPSRVSQR